ncbi:phosphotransferase family protein [Streptomyces sp. NBC_01530]|uniref:phosphotransferase family protein n=1 Tax=Streptomyces sp. NBC_01530 TaxID=2903895 RepID=UPI0038643EF8
MHSRTKRHLAPDQLDALLRAGTGVGCRVESELSDGWFSTVYRVRLDDGRPAVVKLAPPEGAAVLRYERGILGTEAMVYRRIAGLPSGEVPTPISTAMSTPMPIPTAELLYAEREFLVLSVVEGTTWDKAADRLPLPAEAAARRELGAITARLHTLAPEDGRFGYPAAQSGLLATDWRTAFTAMVEALLEDAEHWQSPLDAPPAEIRRLVAEGGDALDEVTEPRLVHFDLWPGNIFVDPADDGSHARITGLIDHERAFWGFPVKSACRDLAVSCGGAVQRCRLRPRLSSDVNYPYGSAGWADVRQVRHACGRAGDHLCWSASEPRATVGRPTRAARHSSQFRSAGPPPPGFHKRARWLRRRHFEPPRRLEAAPICEDRLSRRWPGMAPF